MTGIEARAQSLVAWARSGDDDALVRGSLVLASVEHGDIDAAPIVETLAAMGHEASRRLALVEGAEDRIAALNDYLFEDLGFHGNESRYDDPRNSFVNDVLVRRTGIPISLAVVYLDVGRRAGLQLEGVNFPGHFLVRAPSSGPHVPDLLIDVFHRGAILREIDCQRLLERHAGGEVVLTAEALATADTRQTLMRMATNLKRLYVRSRSFPQALEVTHLLVALDETATMELRDRGLLAYQLKRFPDALRDLEQLPAAALAAVPHPGRRPARRRQRRPQGIRADLGAREDAPPPRRRLQLSGPEVCASRGVAGVECTLEDAMQVFTNLTFDGDCEEAFAVYARLLGGTVTFTLRYRDSPMAGDVPPAWADKIVHTTLSLPGGGRALRLRRAARQLRAGPRVLADHQPARRRHRTRRLRRPRRRRPRHPAARSDVLGRGVRDAGRSLRRALGDQLRTAARALNAEPQRGVGLGEVSRGRTRSDRNPRSARRRPASRRGRLPAPGP